MQSKKKQEILLSKQEWLNNDNIDVGQRLICREIGMESTFQSALNSQKKVKLPLKPVMQDQIQLLHAHKQNCDSLHTCLMR